MLFWQKKRKLKALQKELEAFMLERQFRADVLRDYGNSAAYQFLIFKYQVERDICEDETLLPLYQEKIDFLRELAQAENKRLPFFEKPFYASAACYGSPWFPMGSKDMGGSSEDSETRQDAAHGPALRSQSSRRSRPSRPIRSGRRRMSKTKLPSRIFALGLTLNRPPCSMRRFSKEGKTVRKEGKRPSSVKGCLFARLPPPKSSTIS